MKNQPIRINTQGLIADKLFYRICIASTNSFLDLSISFPPRVTSIYLSNIQFV